MVEPTHHPELPEDLCQACIDGVSVLYAGAGLSARVGLPTWRRFVTGLLDWAITIHAFDSDFADSLRAALKQGDADSVADNVVSRCDPSALNEYLRRIFLRTRRLSSAHKVLRDIPLSAALTTNFDALLEHTFAEKSQSVFTPKDASPLLDTLSGRRFFVLKLYGTLEQPDSVLLAPVQYEQVISGNRAFAEFMEALFFSRTLLFIGASLEGIEAYLRGIALPTGRLNRRHYALVSVRLRGWESRADLLERRYGIQVLPYNESRGHPEVLDFLSRLRDRVLAAQSRRTTATASGRSTEPTLSPLKRVMIENIGPFDQLDLLLQPQWNILLGDNGVGKSTILKALALALVGKDAEPYAHRLVKSSLKPASVTLETEGSVYKTIIKSGATPGTAEVQSIPARALEAEGWLALGFPPLRTVSWSRPTSPEALARGRPTTADLLPLIQGDPDPRLDRLKQWIVNLDYWIKDERSKTGSGGRYEGLLHDFFHVVGLLTEGITMRFKEVRPQTNEVIVVTDDGELPFESVSQGTTSLIGWVGILLQRLYEVFEGDHPRQRHALVLIDEIDAHLHPAWQQTLVKKLADIFPNVQFIATTHSPLIVGGMAPSQVFRFARNEAGKVVELRIESDMLLGRADQILTGDLFGLTTTIDSTTQTEMDKYSALLAKAKRTNEEEQEFRRLQGILRFRIPMSGETPAERRAQELLKVLLREQAGELFPDTQAEVLSAAERLISSLQRNKA